MFVIVTGVTACTVNPALINWFKMIVRMPFGASVQQDTITYIHQGISEEFISLEELLTMNDLDIYYPAVLPETVKLKHIEVFDENGTQIISFKFTSDDFHYTVQVNNQQIYDEQDAVYEIETDEFHFDVYSRQGYYIAYSKIEDSIYMIQAKDIDDIILISSGLRRR
jgi:hypothetical protein